jgi:DNA-binding CsgD family transcriptional regulator
LRRQRHGIRVVDPPQRPEAISIDRPHGALFFGEREVTLLKLLHDEIAPLVGVRLATDLHLSRDGLSRRLRETLNLLLEGHSEKQVATTLGLSQRTVHDYVTRLYEHFRVSSRPSSSHTSSGAGQWRGLGSSLTFEERPRWLSTRNDQGGRVTGHVGLVVRETLNIRRSVVLVAK